MSPDLMRTYWRDEHGHLYRVHGTTGSGDEDTEVRLEWIPPPRQAVSYGWLLARFTRVEPELEF